MKRELTFRSSGGEIRGFGSAVEGESSDFWFILGVFGRLEKENYKEFSNRLIIIMNYLVELRLDLNWERYFAIRI